MGAAMQFDLIQATQRSKALLIVSAVFVAFGALYSPQLLGTGVALVVLLACVRLYAVLELYAVSRCRARVPRVFAVEGDLVGVEVVVENPTPIPVATAEVSVEHSPYLKLVEGARAFLALIPARGSVRATLRFRARVGAHRVGPLRLAVRDPFGLFRFDYTIEATGLIRCAPRASDVVVGRLMVFTRTTGLTRSRRAGYGVELYSVREYRPGDDVRRLVWKHLASKGRLTVREMELEAMNRVVFVVDGTADTLAGPYGHTPFEYSCRVVASIARYLSKRGDLVGTVVFAEDEVYATPKLARGYRRAVEPFADYRPCARSERSEDDRVAALGRAFRRVLGMLPREKSMVFVFAPNPTPRYRDALVEAARRLVALGHDVYVVLPLVTTFEIRGMPEWAQAVYRVKTLDVVKEHLEYARTLRRYGVRTIVAGAQHVPQIVVSMLEARYGR